MRRIGIIAAVLFGALALAGIAGIFWLRTSLPVTAGTFTVAGIAAPVTIIRDGNAIPHIFAGSAQDATFALGFVHAQDRLWQMDMMRRLAAGRLAEILGDVVLGTDSYIRTLGLERAAQAQWRETTPEVRAVLQAYAAGVNAWMATRDGALPPEFVLLRSEPEAWRPVDSLLWSRLMALRLGRNRHTELLRVRIARALAANGLRPGLIDELWPNSDGPVTIDDALQKADATFNLPALGGIPTDSGSNGWVVAGRHSESGKPVLANDPHLRFGAPGLWYLARLDAPDWQLTGATVPGVPLMILGHNGTIAWGITAGEGDVEDHFLETLDPAEPNRYRTPDGLRRFATRTEIVKVKDADDVTLTIRGSRHGPVVSDASKRIGEAASAGQVIAYTGTALAPGDRTVEAQLAINRARDWPSFRAAALLFHAPHVNLLFADTAGDIGFVSTGRIPLRRSGDGRVPVPGDSGKFDWTGFIPLEEMPALHNPASGVIVNANNRPVGPDFPYSLTRDWAPPHRAQRIAEALAATGKHSVEGARRLQLDALSPAARLLVPLMTRIQPEDDDAREALDLLRSWDFTMDRGRPEPAIYATWLSYLTRAMIDDELSPPQSRHSPLRNPRPAFIRAALTSLTHWCDTIGNTAVGTCDGLLELSLDRALADLRERLGSDIEDWRWGDLHQARFVHPVLSHVWFAQPFADLAIATDGGLHTVNRGGYTGISRIAPFAHIDGAGFRAVYDLADLANSRFVIATGQSGNLLSPHYDDFLERWRDGEMVTIAGSRTQLEAASDTVLTLVPR